MSNVVMELLIVLTILLSFGGIMLYYALIMRVASISIQRGGNEVISCSFWEESLLSCKSNIGGKKLFNWDFLNG